MNRLNVDRVLEVVGQLTAPPPEAPKAAPMQGGWGDPGKDHDKAHYFRITGPSPDSSWGGTEPEPAGWFDVASLCGHINGSCKPEELTECDPLALDHCTECRVELLKHRGLI